MTKTQKFPKWLHKPMPPVHSVQATSDSIQKARLHTVCEEAKCPNRLECYAQKTATFLLLGSVCTRACSFCEIGFSKTPPPPDQKEPEHVAQCVQELGLQHVVLTMVARDDLTDGGAHHLAHVIQAIHNLQQPIDIEVLTSDFSGSFAALDLLAKQNIHVFNHNVETTEDLTPQVRHKATYHRSLSMLRYAKKHNTAPFIKSGLMVGLGETPQTVKATLIDLKKAGCDIVTIGQYLQASKRKRRVKEFIHPDRFKEYERFGYRIGIKKMYCGPFVRSSYHAKEVTSNL